MKNTTQYEISRGQWTRIESIEHKIVQNRQRWYRWNRKKMKVVKSILIRNEEKDRRIFEIDRRLSRLDVERDELERQLRVIIK